MAVLQYLLNPDQLTDRLEAKSLTDNEADQLLKELVTNILVNQANAAFPTENPLELFYVSSQEKKV